MKENYSLKIIRLWLWIGLGMVIFQIFLGGITRLTGSGLSITHWDIVTGIMFPIGNDKWNYYFDLYKKTPQFAKINATMSLSEFKFIFFWEYVHRLWARLMGFVFIIPLCFFIWKKWISNKLMKQLVFIFLMAAFVASLGWIMVASGLVNKPWVNAYKLSFHLIAAVCLLSYIFIVILKLDRNNVFVIRPVFIGNFILVLIGCVLLQIFLGGVMAGMKAAIIAPTWPMINGLFIPKEIFSFSSYSDYLFSEYDFSHRGPLIIQFLHRCCSYLILILIAVLFFICLKKFRFLKSTPLFYLLLICVFQMLLGIWTLIYSVGHIPLWQASFHQLGGILLLLMLIHLYFRFGEHKEAVQ